MNIRLNISDPNGMKKFVQAAESNDSSVLVSKEGFRNVFDGASIMSMMYLLSTNIIVNCESCSNALKQIMDSYMV